MNEWDEFYKYYEESKIIGFWEWLWIIIGGGNSDSGSEP